MMQARLRSDTGVKSVGTLRTIGACLPALVKVCLYPITHTHIQTENVPKYNYLGCDGFQPQFLVLSQLDNQYVYSEGNKVQ